MNEFRFLPVWIAIFAAAQQYIAFTAPEMYMGTVREKWTPLWAAVLFFPIFHLAAFGPVIGDVGMYIAGYNQIPASWPEIWAQAAGAEGGKAFILFEGIVKMLSGGNVQVFRAAIALLQSIPVIFIFRKYSDDYLVTVFLFVANCCHIAWMMNGLRQFLAAVIIYAATPLMLKRRYVLTVLVILAAASVHTSALVMLPVVFITAGKAWNKRTLLYVVAAIAGVFILNRNALLLDMMFTGTEYENAVATWQDMGDDGVNPLRVLVNAVPVALAFIYRNYFDSDEDPVMNLLTNMSVVNLGVYMIAMVTSGIMTGRIPAYMDLYNHILLPNIIYRVFDDESRRLIICLMVFFYLIYFWYSGGLR